MSPMTLSFRTKTKLRLLGSVLVPKLSPDWTRVVSHEPNGLGFSNQVDDIENALRNDAA